MNEAREAVEEYLDTHDEITTDHMLAWLYLHGFIIVPFEEEESIH